MSKSISKKFEDFKVRNSLTNELIIKIMKEYANSNRDLACTHFCEKYNISAHTFYKARDYAIICCLLDNQTYERIKKKTNDNYKEKNPQRTSRKSAEHFSYLYEERKKYLKSFSDNEIKDMAYKYAEGISLESIANEYETGRYAIKWLLAKGIIKLIVDEETMQIIGNKLGDRLEEILIKREKNKRVMLDIIKTEINLLDSQINNYKMYCRIIGQLPEKEILEQKLFDAIKKQQEILRL